MLESNSPRDNRCDSSWTMSDGRFGALFFQKTIGPIDRPCLKNSYHCNRTLPDVLPMSQERTVTYVSGPDMRWDGGRSGIRTPDPFRVKEVL
jgi:hypothetical protein